MSDEASTSSPAEGQKKIVKKVVKKVVKKKATGEDGASTSAAPKVAAAAEEASKAESSAKTEWEPKPPRNPERKLKDFEEVQQVDYIRTMTARNVWYYRDRLSVPRGPCTMPVLREAWSNGIIDGNTLVWGEGLVDWLPINNVRTLTAQIRTPEVRLATWLRKTFVLKPAIERARKERAEHRNHVSDQLDQFN